MTKIAITGAGIVSPIGIGLEQFWEAAIQGKSGVRRISLFDPSTFTCHVAGEVGDVRQAPHYKATWDSYDRVTILALLAAAEAVDVAKIGEGKIPSHRVGTYVGTGIGGVTSHESECARFIAGRRVHPLAILRVMSNAPAAALASHFSFTGPSMTSVSACSSSSQAIAAACIAIERNEVDFAIAGGTEAPISQPLYAAWDSMRVMSRWEGPAEGACRPFSQDRTGMVLAEGAAFVMLEKEASARERDASILGFIDGIASNTTISHPTAPDLQQEVNVMRAALEASNIAPEEISYVHAHGTGTPANDVTETQALRQVFRQHAQRLQVSSGKSMYGHPLGAAGAIGLISSLFVLRRNAVPPTINLEVPDPECDLNYVPCTMQPLAAPGKALINSFAFGGTNVAIVIST